MCHLLSRAQNMNERWTTEATLYKREPSTTREIPTRTKEARWMYILAETPKKTQSCSTTCLVSDRKGLVPWWHEKIGEKCIKNPEARSQKTERFIHARKLYGEVPHCLLRRGIPPFKLQMHWYTRRLKKVYEALIRYHRHFKRLSLKVQSWYVSHEAFQGQASADFTHELCRSSWTLAPSSMYAYKLTIALHILTVYNNETLLYNFRRVTSTKCLARSCLKISLAKGFSCLFA